MKSLEIVIIVTILSSPPPTIILSSFILSKAFQVSQITFSYILYISLLYKFKIIVLTSPEAINKCLL